MNPGMGMNPFMAPPVTPRPTGLGMPSMDKPISSLSSDEIDKMIADIDKKLKELDEEEERERALQEKKKEMDLPKLEEPKKEPELPKLEETKEGLEPPKKVDIPEVVVEEEKPKIHVDKDSVVMNDNTITDDEFFDDFFS